MRKLLLSILAVLFIVGIANATSIPVGVDPKNYPAVWTEAVYNGSGSSITSGYIVQWDFDASTGDFADQCNWVKLNATDEGVWQAGVVPYGRNLADGDSGSIIVKGPAYALVGTAVVADQLVASNANGKISPFDGGANDETALGVAIRITSLATGAPDNGAAGANGWALIYVDPARYDEN